MGDLERAVTLSGVGLHGGSACAVTFAAAVGPTRIGSAKGSFVLGSPRLARVDRGVRLSLEGGDEIELVEHLAAAIGGMGAFAGVRVEVQGGEVPLLDGGARAFVDGLLSIGARKHEALLRVQSPMTYVLGESRYELAPARETRLEVEIAFAHPRIGRQRATWDGDADDFRDRVAPARTFGFLRDAGLLAETGRARHVDLARVIVFGERDVVEGCELRGDDEPARHKLLDVIGDLALYGGPPRGLIRAFRPGHAATHAMVREALVAGHLVRGGDA